MSAHAQCLGKVGEVIKVDKEGDIVVKFGDRIWVFAPTCCVAAPEAKIDYISSRNVRGGETIKIRLGGFLLFFFFLLAFSLL